MNNENLNIKIDMRPYLPDIYIKDKIYTSLDTIDYETVISSHKTIFIFNLNDSFDLTSIYNDMGYMLYGIKKPGENYLFPPLFYFNTEKKLTTDNHITPYRILNTETTIDISSGNLLSRIGYNIYDINPLIYQKYEIQVIDELNKKKRNILCYYFNYTKTNSLTQINYNLYNSTIYNNRELNNILIYPYINTLIEIKPLNKKWVNIISETNLTSTLINDIEFDNKDTLKYYEKINYKNFEKTNNIINQNNKIKLLQNYSKNIENIKEFYKTKKHDININLNEINQLFINNKQNITYNYLNNLHINNNKTYSNNNNKYSYSNDNKSAVSNKNKYSIYNYDITNGIPSIYQKSSNYHVNCYYNIKGKYDYEIKIINNYLYKLLVLINPRVINLDYLLNNIELNINDIFQENNKLEFGINADKINLNIISTISETDTYYINKYKIEYIFIDEETDKEYKYIIIASIIFYNGNKIKIKDINETNKVDDLAFTSYTNEELEITTGPTVSKNTELYDIYENMSGIKLLDTQKYRFMVNFVKISEYHDIYNLFYYNHFHYVIPSYCIEYKYNNYYNIQINKVNNFIKNVMNIFNSLDTLLLDTDKNKSVCLTSVLYDSNIDELYTYSYTYLPILIYNPIYPITNIYQNVLNNLNYVPAGVYKIFNYTNITAQKLFSSGVDDDFIRTINKIELYLQYNFCLMIEEPNNFTVDDKYFSDNYTSSSNFWITDNYTYNIGNNISNVYLVILDTETNKPYKTAENFIIGYKLNKELVINLFETRYYNLTQFTLLFNFHTIYREQNSMIMDITKTRLKLHNEKYLMDIVKYDNYRFNYPEITEYTDMNFTKIIYNNKQDLNTTRNNYKILIGINNFTKILILLSKCINYLIISKNNIIFSINENTPFPTNELALRTFINNICNIIDICNSNLKLNFTYSITSSEINAILEKARNMKNILEMITSSIFELKYVYNYFLNKKLLSINYLRNNGNITSAELEYINNEIRKNLYKLEITDLIRLELEENIIKLEISKNKITNENLIEQIKAYLYIVLFNTSKINEIYNLISIPNSNITGSTAIYVKQDYIYDTTYYNTDLVLANFNPITFLNDMILMINYGATTTNPDSYITVINMGIIQIVNDIIIEYSDICDKIKKIYNKTYNIGLPIDQLDIYDAIEIGIFYMLLSSFEEHINQMYDILENNNLEIYNEYQSLKKYLCDVLNQCLELLQYVQIKMDILNMNTNFVNTEISEIISLEGLYQSVTQMINNNDKLILYNDNEQLTMYLTYLIEKSKIQYMGDIQDLIIELGFLNILKDNYVVYNDNNLLEINSRYVYNSDIDIINIIELYNSSLFNASNLYYNNVNNIEFSKQIINYEYLVNPFIYININNPAINVQSS